jgi:hypothetical protein
LLSVRVLKSLRGEVVDSGAEPFPRITTFFERGVIGGPSADGALMIKVLIDPCVYIQFFDHYIIIILDRLGTIADYF